MLIAIVSDSYTSAMAQVNELFYLARLQLVTQVNTIFSPKIFPRALRPDCYSIVYKELLGDGQREGDHLYVGCGGGVRGALGRPSG